MGKPGEWIEHCVVFEDGLVVRENRYIEVLMGVFYKSTVPGKKLAIPRGTRPLE